MKLILFVVMAHYGHWPFASDYWVDRRAWIHHFASIPCQALEVFINSTYIFFVTNVQNWPRWMFQHTKNIPLVNICSKKDQNWISHCKTKSCFCRSAATMYTRKLNKVCLTINHFERNLHNISLLKTDVYRLWVEAVKLKKSRSYSQSSIIYDTLEHIYQRF